MKEIRKYISNKKQIACILTQNGIAIPVQHSISWYNIMKVLSWALTKSTFRYFKDGLGVKLLVNLKKIVYYGLD